MKSYFIFDRAVTGKEFTGRAAQIQTLRDMLSAAGHTVVYGEPKSGKTSLVRETLARIVSDGVRLTPVTVSLTGARTAEDILVAFVSDTLRCFCGSPQEYGAAASEYLAGTHFKFDETRFTDIGKSISVSDVPDSRDVAAAFALADTIAWRKGVKTAIFVRDIQNILFSPESDTLLSILGDVLKTCSKQSSFIFHGSMMNATEGLFKTNPRLRGNVSPLLLPPVSLHDIPEYVNVGFKNSGKVLEKELTIQVASLLRCNMWYVNQIFFIADSLTRGYVTKPLLDDAMELLYGIHRPRFTAVLSSLTNFQHSFLKAITDGCSSFSSSEILERYGLNSSANVKRIKEALMKKEIIRIDADERTVIQDPLFELWLKNKYFQHH